MIRGLLSAEQQEIVEFSGQKDLAFADRFWENKIEWMNAGDRSPEGHTVIRSGGGHYAFIPGIVDDRGRRSLLGYGGRRFTFRYADGSTVTSNNVWFQGKIPLRYRHILTDNADLVTEHEISEELQPSEHEATMANLSQFPHPTYAVDFEIGRDVIAIGDDEDGQIEYDVSTAMELRHEAPLEESQVWSSLIDSGPHAGKHVFAVDVDQQCRLVPTSTPGHYHLVIDKAITWAHMKQIMHAMALAGIVEQGYYDASIRREAAHLRLPWVRKADLNDRQREQQKADAARILDEADGVTKLLRYTSDGHPFLVTAEEAQQHMDEASARVREEGPL